MKFDEFPSKILEKIEKSKQIEIDSENLSTDSIICELENKKPLNPGCLFPFLCALVGCFFGGSILLYVLVILAGGSVDDPPFGLVAASGLIGMFILAPISWVLVSKYQKAKHEAKETAWNQNIEQVRIASMKKIDSIKTSANKKFNDYLTAFDVEAKRLSTSFEGSTSAKTAIDWMLGGFHKTIDAAVRSPHIIEINVPFVLNVYTDKITCNLGTFDFEKNRCSNLNSPLQQAALANFVASKLQLMTQAKYQKDSSGTSVNVKRSTAYKNDYASSTVTYTAANGYYQHARSW